jgi:hypothetical protein
VFVELLLDPDDMLLGGRVTVTAVDDDAFTVVLPEISLH